jgi:hypothetical protein
MQLLNAGDGGSAIANFSAVLEQGNVYLSRTQNDALNFVMGINVVRFMTFIRDDPLEVRCTGEFADGRTGLWMTE